MAQTKTKIKKMRPSVIFDPGYLSAKDIADFKRGEHFSLFTKFGAHLHKVKGKEGVYFVVWAPHAKSVSVIGAFNQWDYKANLLLKRPDHSGLWEGMIPGIGAECLYKFHIESASKIILQDKIDPFAFRTEKSPKTASIVKKLNYNWADDAWMRERRRRQSLDAPISIYEVHLGSWRRPKKAGVGFLTYRELAAELVPYVKTMGFTHVEFMPVMEHPYYGSWGYQALNFFAPTSRYGPPEDLMYLIDTFHQNGIGVILDWVPSHFPDDHHGLALFDGTTLFENKGNHPDWLSCIFNNGKGEVISFLISNAVFWLQEYHIDALRVDAVASMLYLDYSRNKGEWQPNTYGSNENLESVAFIRLMNNVIKERFPEVHVIAEESSAWPGVTKSEECGGLNFSMKWNMGWMFDTLKYFQYGQKERKKNQGELTFSLFYAFNENFLLPLSHDEVVHEKSSLLGKMPGKKDEDKFANLRAIYGYMYGFPGKKLLFMGNEIAQWKEWNHDTELEWPLMQHEPHQGMQKWVQAINKLYAKKPALHSLDFSPEGFTWIDINTRKLGLVSFLRHSAGLKNTILVICNFSNTFHKNLSLSVPIKGIWKEVLSSDEKRFFGKGLLKKQVIKTTGFDSQNRKGTLKAGIPPLSVIFFNHE